MVPDSTVFLWSLVILASHLPRVSVLRLSHAISIKSEASTIGPISFSNTAASRPRGVSSFAWAEQEHGDDHGEDYCLEESVLAAEHHGPSLDSFDVHDEDEDLDVPVLRHGSTKSGSPLEELQVQEDENTNTRIKLRRSATPASSCSSFASTTADGDFLFSENSDSTTSSRSSGPGGWGPSSVASSSSSSSSATSASSSPLFGPEKENLPENKNLHLQSNLLLHNRRQRSCKNFCSLMVEKGRQPPDMSIDVVKQDEGVGFRSLMMPESFLREHRAVYALDREAVQTPQDSYDYVIAPGDTAEMLTKSISIVSFISDQHTSKYIRLPYWWHSQLRPMQLHFVSGHSCSSTATQVDAPQARLQRTKSRTKVYALYRALDGNQENKSYIYIFDDHHKRMTPLLLDMRRLVVWKHRSKISPQIRAAESSMDSSSRSTIDNSYYTVGWSIAPPPPNDHKYSLCSSSSSCAASSTSIEAASDDRSTKNTGCRETMTAHVEDAFEDETSAVNVSVNVVPRKDRQENRNGKKYTPFATCNIKDTIHARAHGKIIPRKNSNRANKLKKKLTSSRLEAVPEEVDAWSDEGASSMSAQALSEGSTSSSPSSAQEQERPSKPPSTTSTSASLLSRRTTTSSSLCSALALETCTAAETSSGCILENRALRDADVREETRLHDFCHTREESREDLQYLLAYGAFGGSAALSPSKGSLQEHESFSKPGKEIYFLQGDAEMLAMLSTLGIVKEYDMQSVPDTRRSRKQLQRHEERQEALQEAFMKQYSELAPGNTSPSDLIFFEATTSSKIQQQIQKIPGLSKAVVAVTVDFVWSVAWQGIIEETIPGVHASRDFFVVGSSTVEELLPAVNEWLSTFPMSKYVQKINKVVQLVVRLAGEESRARRSKRVEESGVDIIALPLAWRSSSSSCDEQNDYASTPDQREMDDLPVLARDYVLQDLMDAVGHKQLHFQICCPDHSVLSDLDFDTVVLDEDDSSGIVDGDNITSDSLQSERSALAGNTRNIGASHVSSPTFSPSGSTSSNATALSTASSRRFLSRKQDELHPVVYQETSRAAGSQDERGGSSWSSYNPESLFWEASGAPAEAPATSMFLDSATSSWNSNPVYWAYPYGVLGGMQYDPTANTVETVPILFNGVPVPSPPVSGVGEQPMFVDGPPATADAWKWTRRYDSMFVDGSATAAAAVAAHSYHHSQSWRHANPEQLPTCNTHDATPAMLDHVDSSNGSSTTWCNFYDWRWNPPPGQDEPAFQTSSWFQTSSTNSCSTRSIVRRRSRTAKHNDNWWTTATRRTRRDDYDQDEERAPASQHAWVPGAPYFNVNGTSCSYSYTSLVPTTQLSDERPSSTAATLISREVDVDHSSGASYPFFGGSTSSGSCTRTHTAGTDPQVEVSRPMNTCSSTTCSTSSYLKGPWRWLEETQHLQQRSGLMNTNPVVDASASSWDDERTLNALMEWFGVDGENGMCEASRGMNTAAARPFFLQQEDVEAGTNIIDSIEVGGKGTGNNYQQHSIDDGAVNHHSLFHPKIATCLDHLGGFAPVIRADGHCSLSSHGSSNVPCCWLDQRFSADATSIFSVLQQQRPEQKFEQSLRQAEAGTSRVFSDKSSSSATTESESLYTLMKSMSSESNAGEADEVARDKDGVTALGRQLIESFKRLGKRSTFVRPFGQQPLLRRATTVVTTNAREREDREG